ncbi:MAG: GyrI-like domain-containing protein [Bacteroidota bacterium]|nr:GyrI-like domain-containing protein [Bacteroidota bacterium]MDP3144313.1 GyrI-like domain-containing protein [Bacteroidota bacterium]MDP3556299.1 GyrI-like domain-containing protein [Bacteroidota bacterium]
MKSLFLKITLAVIITSVLFSCNNSEKDFSAEKQTNDSLTKGEIKIVDFAEVGNNEGVVGVFNVPEMLAICKYDSAPMKDVSFKIAKAYSILETEMNDIGATMDGMPGMITFNNDTSNFKFECVLLIKEMPKKQPKTCKIVVLESSQMLIYNFYGPYKHLFSAYDKIRKYNAINKLVQIGPMREFYLSDPSLEKDPSKWQTRIMVPVVGVK